MERDYEALQQAYRAHNVFEGIGDSFGAQMCSDVADNVITNLERNRNGREDCIAQMRQMLATLDQCQEMMQS